MPAFGRRGCGRPVDDPREARSTDRVGLRGPTRPQVQIERCRRHPFFVPDATGFEPATPLGENARVRTQRVRSSGCFYENIKYHICKKEHEAINGLSGLLFFLAITE